MPHNWTTPQGHLDSHCQGKTVSRTLGENNLPAPGNREPYLGTVLVTEKLI